MGKIAPWSHRAVFVLVQTRLSYLSYGKFVFLQKITQHLPKKGMKDNFYSEKSQ